MVSVELKFRVWDGEQLHYGGFSIHATGKIEPTIFIKNEIKCIDQFIGIKDKNGRDVYTNDILSDGAVVKKFDNLSWEGDGSRHPGFYCSQWFEYPFDDTEELNYFHRLDNTVEVIGNIHKNPELLK